MCVDHVGRLLVVHVVQSVASIPCNDQANQLEGGGTTGCAAAHTV